MMNEMERLKSALSGTVRLANELKADYQVNPAVGSRADAEIAEGMTAGRYRLLVEAYSMSETRLVASASHLSAVTVLLDQGPVMAHAISGLARTAIESSARASWLLDHRIDGWTRGLRTVAELLYVFREEGKFPIPAVQETAAARLTELIEGAESLAEPIRNRRGEVLHFGERRPDATEVIRHEVGDRGEIVYRELSGVAHGNVTAHVRLTEPVPEDERLGITIREPRMTIHQPVPLIKLAPYLGVVWLAFSKALGWKVTLYGWNRDRFRAWTTEAGRAIGEVLKLD